MLAKWVQEELSSFNPPVMAKLSFLKFPTHTTVHTKSVLVQEDKTNTQRMQDVLQNINVNMGERVI